MSSHESEGQGTPEWPIDDLQLWAGIWNSTCSVACLYPSLMHKYFLHDNQKSAFLGAMYVRLRLGFFALLVRTLECLHSLRKPVYKTFAIVDCELPSTCCWLVHTMGRVPYWILRASLDNKEKQWVGWRSVLLSNAGLNFSVIMTCISWLIIFSCMFTRNWADISRSGVFWKF